ncbi:MAG: secretin N-terminal domain-containing protein [Vicinamibacteria bacterium]
MSPRSLRALALCAAFVVAGCASSSAFKLGEKAERSNDWDRAVVEYSKAVQLAPDNASYRQSLERARLRASQAHTRAGRVLLGRGLYKEAIDELRLALDLVPGSPTVAADLREAEERRQAGIKERSLAEIKDRARERPLSGLSLGPEAREPLGMSFRGASLREAYLALGRATGVNFVFDPGFLDQTISIDLREVPFEQALNGLAAAGRTFHRVVDARVVSVLPDTPAKRREFEEQTVKTFFLSNADLKETIDLLRIVLGARRVAPLPGSNALTINDTPEKVAAAERIVEIVDKKRAEVVIEVEILEVNRSRLKEYGIEITSGIPGVDGIAGAVFPDPNKTYTLGDNPYDKDNLVITSLPGVIYRLLQQDTSTRLLANPQLRTSEGQTAQARFGDQVPVPVTTFSPIATGGVSQQPITSFEYKNVGVNIDITPRVHHDGEITLGLKLEISAVGPLFQNLPTFNSRSVTSVLRLRDGETTILAGLISETERESLSGIPGLASLPFLGKLFSHNKKEVQATDIVMTMTPHVVRRPELTLEDLRSFQLGSETAPLLFEVPALTAPPASPSAGAPEAQRIAPIRPPAPAPTPSPEGRQP